VVKKCRRSLRISPESHAEKMARDSGASVPDRDGEGDREEVDVGPAGEGGADEGRDTRARGPGNQHRPPGRRERLKEAVAWAPWATKNR